jgi:hypothetical protein
MTLRITQANVSGFTGDSEVIPVDPEEGQFYIPSAVELFDVFSIDLIFEGVYVDPIDPLIVSYQYATDVRSTFDWDSIGITFTKLNDYTVRLTGPAENVFTNQYYRFKMTDYTEQVLPADTELPYFGLIRYQMPIPTIIMKTYPFEADLPADALSLAPATTEEFNMFQWMFWRFQVALANIAAANEKGLK